MAHLVICPYCNEKFDRDKQPFTMVGSRRYAHPDCATMAELKKSQEEKDKQVLDEYIMKLFNLEYVEPKIRKYINKFVTEYKYTYSGIYKTLVYFYEIKGNSLDKANGNIGIVPYTYAEAYAYYYALDQAKKKNAEINISAYQPKVKVVSIQRPQRKIKKRKLFNFLEENE
jgi:hypothetical protein